MRPSGSSTTREVLAELLSTVAEDYGLDLNSAFMRSTRATPRPSATRRGKPRVIRTLAESSAAAGVALPLRIRPHPARDHYPRRSTRRGLPRGRDPQRGADPEPVVLRHRPAAAPRRRSPRSTASTARAGSSQRMTHRIPGSTAVALRMSHRGDGIRRTPRRTPMTATAPHRKTALPGKSGARSRRPQYHAPVAVGTCDGQPAQPFIELVDAVYARLGATEVFLETGMGTCSVCWCFGKYLMPKAPALAFC